MGGHSSDSSWFRAKTETLLGDVVILQRGAALLQWTLPDASPRGAVGLQGPSPREFHTLTPTTTDGRMLLFGGRLTVVVF